MKKQLSGNSLTVPLMAVCLLLILSLVNWNDITCGRITNFNLIEDIVEIAERSGENASATMLIDPALELALSEVTSEEELPVHELDMPDEMPVVESDQPEMDIPAVPVEKINGIQPIEDFSPARDGFKTFRDAISCRNSRRVRIAVVGDSYIEGDIFTQDIRRLLQSEYGGRGVGYMCMHSEFPGFRRSVNQSDNKWTVSDMRNKSSDPVRPISGEYCIGSVGSTTTFKGAKAENVRRWSSSKLLYIASSDGSVEITTDSMSVEHPVVADGKVNMMSLADETSKAIFKSKSDRIKVLGAWLEDDYGVGVDCMSLRGNSGASHKSLSVELAAETSAFITYDLIIIEYGLNALSAEQSDYTSYGKLISKVVARIKDCYPASDILILGVGDRGFKNGSVVKSIPTVEAMIDAQRACARECGVMFWDTRAAMGGVDAIVDWRKRGLVNADYIHLNHKGGEVLAEEFVNALNLKLNEGL